MQCSELAVQFPPGIFHTLHHKQYWLAYGYVFAGCNLAAVAVVYFFLPEANKKFLKEIDTMFLLEAPPTKSSK